MPFPSSQPPYPSDSSFSQVSTSSQPPEDLFQSASASTHSTTLSTSLNFRICGPQRDSTSTCCKCNGPNARCISCKCCQEKRACINCFPGGRGKCVNIMNIVSSIPPQTTEPGIKHQCATIPGDCCDSSMSSLTQALMPPPPEVSHQQPITPSSQLLNLPNSTLPATMQSATQRIYNRFQSSIGTRRPKKKVHGRGLPCFGRSFQVESAHVSTCQWILLRRGPEFMAGGPVSFCLPLLPSASLHL